MGNPTYSRHDFPVNPREIDHLLDIRSSAPNISPDLVHETAVRQPQAYNRLRDLDSKAAFRQKILNHLLATFKTFGTDSEAHQRLDDFITLAGHFDKDGAVVFGNMIQIPDFETLVTAYNSKLATNGSKSWIHSYINLANHADFIKNDAFNDAFIHPLLVTLMAYAAGGAIRLVDARGKDAEPLAVQAQDNMLHIDNTPFRKEYKIILTWERGKASGPKGQNFVFIPGTHKAARNCQVDSNGQAWSTEDGSIFTSKTAIRKMFAAQAKTHTESPVVVEATHPDMPLTTVFEAGALVHHRYRTEEKNIPRSCVIFAFHRAIDNPGQFLRQARDSAPVSLLDLLLGNNNDNTEERFIQAIAMQAALIATKLQELQTKNYGTEILPFTGRKLIASEFSKWEAAVTSAPTVEAIKIKKAFFDLNQGFTHPLLNEMMRYDKHGPLDLILYGDSHEESRKWARNRIREMPGQTLENRLAKFFEWQLIRPVTSEDLLLPAQLKALMEQLLALIDQLPVDTQANGQLDPQESIASLDAYRSVHQLIEDLGEAIVRCTSRQTFLSTCLFLFWASDEVTRLLVGPNEKPPSALLAISQPLLTNYLATYCLIEKQICHEASLSSAEIRNKHSIKALLYSNHSLFTQVFLNKQHDTYLEAHRHDTPELQHEYDTRWGLTIR